MIVRILIWGLVFYFLYKFVTEVLLPVIRVSRKMNARVKEFQQQQTAQDHASYTTDTAQPGNKSKVGDYIEFEEIRD
jgi:hypothetical protein